MLRSPYRRAAGFTLTEMAIVLAVVGVLAAGLWNLMSGANTQVRDESAASQQQQLITAVKTFLVSGGGQEFMSSNANCGGNCGGTTAATDLPFNLPLPTAGCGGLGVMNGPTAAAEQSAWCNDLPPGFTSATTNSYGQIYLIQILRDFTPSGQPPNTYSFMILTTGGSSIPAITDTSGARISSLIGGDGGFVYTANVCGAPTTSTCGSYGGWSSTTGAYGFPAPAAPAYSGSIASRTYYSPQQYTFTNWLARVQLDSTYTLNTMTVPEYLGGNALVMGSYPAVGNPPLDQGNNDFYMGNFANPVPTTGGGTFNLQAGVFNFNYAAPAVPVALGTMNMQGGVFNFGAPLALSGGGTMNVQSGTINLQGGGILGTYGAGPFYAAIPGAAMNLLGTSGYSITNNLVNINIDGIGDNASGAGHQVEPPVNILTHCTQDTQGNSLLPINANCAYGLQISGDIGIGGTAYAAGLFANTFIYQGSDSRLKKNIIPLHNSLKDIMKIKPVSYDLKSGRGSGLGVIAQDLKEIYPQLVSQNNNGMKAVNYEGLIAPLIESVQELKRKNDELKTELQNQSLRENELERQLHQGQ